MGKKEYASHWVLAHGVDFDGNNSGQVYAFTNKESADDFARYLSNGSDGLQYETTDVWLDVEEYCHYYGKKSSKYKTINDESYDRNRFE
jgi:hypothetical protein